MIPEPSFPVECVVEFAEVYADRKLTKTGNFAPLGKEELAARFRSLRKQAPEMFERHQIRTNVNQIRYLTEEDKILGHRLQPRRLRFSDAVVAGVGQQARPRLHPFLAAFLLQKTS